MLLCTFKKENDIIGQMFIKVLIYMNKSNIIKTITE